MQTIIEPAPNQRFALIESILELYGQVMRVHLQRAFHISPAAATRILANYRKAHPDCIRLGTAYNRYVKNTKFQTVNLAQFDVDAQKFYDAACIMAGEPIVQIKKYLA